MSIPRPWWEGSGGGGNCKSLSYAIFSSCSSMSSCISWLLLRYCYYEFTSNIHGTFDFNEPMMKTDNVFNNGKSQSGSTHFPRAGRINTIEPFKNTRDMFLRNADTCV